MHELCSELATKEDRSIAKNLEKIDVVFEQNHDLKIYSKKELSIHDIVILLESFSIKVLQNYTYRIDDVWVYLLKIECNEHALLKNLHSITETIKKALLGKELIRCPLYALLLSANFDLDRIHLLRAMSKYLDQILPHYKERTIQSLFLRYPKITEAIIDSFFTRSIDPTIFDPIKTFNEDRFFRIFAAAMQNITKSNFLKNKETISIKFDTAAFKEFLPSPQPNIEIFVYHPDFIGVHLRSSKIARGGIRYSDREDLRQEIRSLMITQEAKNSIIVPSGGKGGFFIYKKVTKEEFKRYYSLYIDALLDVIDLDPLGDDFYFVVAADRGTAAMSDVANSIAIKKGFWMGDAFASGGKSGYSHKELGVTAKGAWHSAARHFHQRNIDIFKDPITIVGTGSMRGDVFGNGMLINPNIRLLGAISSKEIFIDPNPDPKIAYQERKRLFEEQKSWDSYDPSKISEGGGVFLRQEKNIELTPQIKKLLGTKKKSMSGEELAKALLKLPVDMLYIGGIGTYVKSSEEPQIEIEDRANDGVRVDASDLRCFAVCEGGNLGFTQKARIEYAKNGGRINLDHIDNSAGVHTSDYEVNLKIALLQAIQTNKIQKEQRDEFLHSLAPNVLEKVFSENTNQSLVITLDEIASRNDLDQFLKTIEILENEVEYFKRKDYAIPKNKEIDRILDEHGSIVRPVLGILLSYSKIFLKKLLLQSSMIDEPFFEHYLYKYFPKNLYPTFEQEVLGHPLKRSIIATTIANIIIDQMGAGFISDYDRLGKDLFLVKIKSFLILHSLLSIAKVKKDLLAKEKELGQTLYEQLLLINESLNFSLGWMIRNHKELNIEPFHILNYKQEIAEFLQLKGGDSQNFLKYIDLVKFVMLAIYLKESKNRPLKEILQLIEHIIETFRIDQLLKLLYSFTPKNERAREIRHQLVLIVEYFVTIVAQEIILFMRSNESVEEGLNSFLQERKFDIQKLEAGIAEIQKDPNDLTILVHTINTLLLEAI